MWIATVDGLNRYDGYQFKVYRNDSANRYELNTNSITTIFEDDQGIIWIGTINGLSRFNPELDQISHFDLGTDVVTITAITAGESDEIWVSSLNQGVYLINTHDNSVSPHLNLGESKKIGQMFNIKSILYDSQKTLWLANNSGIERYDPNEKRYLPIPDILSILDGYKVKSFFEDSKKRLWIGSQKGLLLYDLSDKKVYYEFHTLKNGLPASSDITSIAEDIDGGMWIATMNNGLFYISQDFTNIKNYEFSKSDSNSLSSNHLTGVYCDQKNRIWISTISDGLNIVSLSSNQYKYMPHELETNGELIQNPVLSLLADSRGILWVGSYGGGISQYSLNGNSNGLAPMVLEKVNKLGGNYVFALYEDIKGNIWISSTKRNVIKYNPKKNSIETINVPSRIISFSEGYDGRLWMGSSANGLGYFDEDKNGFELYSDRPELSSGSITALLVDEDNFLWVGGVNGLIRIDLSDHTVQRYSHDSNNANSLSNDYILSLHQDSVGHIWVGTNADGLNRYLEENNSFVRYGIKNGLVNNVINGMLSDKKGDMWIATDDGLSKYSVNSNRFTSYRTEDGLALNTFVMASKTVSTEGEFFWGHPRGITRFFPDEIEDIESAPVVAFTNFSLFNQSVDTKEAKFRVGREYLLDQSVYAIPQINLSYKERLFSLEFSALNPKKPHRIDYFYKLEGWSDQWISTPYTNRTASFTDIPAGNYVFRVQARDQDGLWESSEASINIHVSPPLWKSSWAYALYVILIFASLIFIVAIRTRMLAERAKTLEKSVRQRTQEIEEKRQIIETLLQKKDELFANVSHEFRTPLTLILGPLDEAIEPGRIRKISEMRERLGVSRINAKRLLRMVDQLLGIARLELQANEHKQTIEVSKSIRDILMCFDSAIANRDIALSFDFEEDLYLDISTDAFEKIITNLLSNALKYTPSSGEIYLACKKENDSLSIIVKDSGIGIAEKYLDEIFERFVRVENPRKDAPGAGIGLALVKQLTEHFGGTIKVQSRLGEGSEFRVSFPCSDTQESLSETTHSSDGIKLELDVLTGMSGAKKEADVDELSNEPDIELDENQSNRQSILIVEDNLEMRRFIKASLNKHFNCVMAEDGQEGGRLAIEGVPDLVITDLMMPKKNGFELSKVLRNDTRTSHIPIIMLTAKTGIETRKESWRSDIDDYFEKPFNAEELLLRVQNLLNIRSLLSQRAGVELSSNDVNAIDALNDRDKEFIDSLISFVSINIENENLDANLICSYMAMSQSQLTRKLKAVAGQTLPEFIRAFRLKQGAQLLLGGARVSEVSYAVGFSTPNYFSSCFKAQYGMTPKAYVASNLEIV